MKVYIIGAAGSGKTTLAKGINQKTNIPYFELDDIFWDNSSKNIIGIKRERPERDTLYNDILNQESWIIEGACIFWPKEGFIKADKLIFLDIKESLLVYRILKRFFFRKLGIIRSNKIESFKEIYKLIKWNKSQIKKIKSFFETETYPNLIHIKNKRDLKQVNQGFL